MSLTTENLCKVGSLIPAIKATANAAISFPISWETLAVNSMGIARFSAAKRRAVALLRPAPQAPAVLQVPLNIIKPKLQNIHVPNPLSRFRWNSYWVS